jgi:hypothetical protein
MSVTRLVPPIDYLNTASRTSLQSFELTRLNHAANLRREISVLMDQWIEETSEALLARWMLEHHSSLHQPSLSIADLLDTIHAPGSDPFPETSQPPLAVHPVPPRLAESRQTMTGTNGGRPHK